jgi:hypothetical protein
MAVKPLNICTDANRDSAAKFIAQTWFNYHSQRFPKLEEWKELRNYIFATDTSTTSNSTLPWKNSTTLPKLCQIRDNLHSNYLSALFPNDDWLRWEAYSASDAAKQKRLAIEAYMSNKTRESHFRTTMSKLLLDYIDYGNAFATVDFEASSREDQAGNKVTGYVGPKIRRISPLDIVFNPLADTFSDSFKIIRSLRSIGELAALAVNEPENHYLKEALANRAKLMSHMNAYGIEEADKSEGFLMDGFGNYAEYLGSQYVEFLQYYGDIYDPKTGELKTGRVITVIDRMYVIQDEPIPQWFGKAPIYHVGWRYRPDNLWAMGPLDNLVGMQYRIDHLENLKADAMDLAVLPPLVIAGEVEEFVYGPGEEIHIDEGGSVTELAKNAQWAIQADNAIQLLEQRMEMYAGAPREAMGVRTPGEKTAFEVQTLENAASRIFQEKINTFEIELLEPSLNGMLETARRNLDGQDVVRVMDNDLGVTEFMSITKDDITASGVLRPIGARHFAAQAQMMQNLQGVFSSPIGQIISPHLSALSLARLVEDILGVNRFSLFAPNKAIFEQQETQRLAQAAQENLGTEQNMAASGASQAAMQPTPQENVMGRLNTLQTRQNAKAMV